MRFVKNLVAAAGLATTVLDGVVGAPASNSHPTPPDPTKPFPPPTHIATSMSSTTTSYSRGGGLPHFSTHTPSVIVPGSSLSGTGNCDPTRTMGAPGNSLPVEPTVAVSDEGIPITTVSATPSVIVTRTPSHGVSEPRMSSNPTSVTRADGVLYEQQGTDRIPDPIITRVASLDDRQMTEKMPGLNERQMTEKMPGLEERQMTEKMPGLDARQMTEKMPGFVARQLLPTSITARQLLPTSITARQMTEKMPGLDQRQMTEKMPGLEERQLLPTSITARQLLPTSVTARGAQKANWVDPPVSEPATQDVEARQLLPTSITARDVPSTRPAAPIGGHPNPDVARESAPIGAHPNPHPYSDVEARQLLPTSIIARGVDGTPVVWPPGVGGPGPNPNFDARQILPTSTIGDDEPPVTTTSAPTTTSTTTTTTMTAEATSCVGGCAVTSITTHDPRADSEATGHVEFAPASQAAESTVTATDLHTVTLQPPSTETTTVLSTQFITVTVPGSSDSCTTLLPSTSAPFPPTNGTLTITIAPTSSSESEDVGETSTSTSTSTSSTETTSSTTETTTSSSSSVASSVTTITTTLDYSCSHESCGPATQTLTKTLDPSSSPPSTSATTTTTAEAASGSTVETSSIDTCTESTTTSSTSAEETTLTTVTTHSTTTLTGTPEQGGAGDDDRTVTMDVTVMTPTLGQGPPRLTPPAITQRDEEDRAGTTVVEAITTTVITTTTTTIDQGPPRLTPPPITRRDDGPPEAGPIDAPPHVTTDNTFTVVPPLSRTSIIVGPPMPPQPEFSPSWSSVRPDLPHTAGGQDRHHHPTPTFMKTTLETSVVPTAA